MEQLIQLCSLVLDAATRSIVDQGSVEIGVELLSFLKSNNQYLRNTIHEMIGDSPADIMSTFILICPDLEKFRTNEVAWNFITAVQQGFREKENA